jgi:ribose transport system substrate-binding protein
MSNNQLSSIQKSILKLCKNNQMSRREFLIGFTLVNAITALSLSGCNSDQGKIVVENAQSTGFPKPTMRAAFSYDGLKSTWSRRGRDTAQFIGQLLGIDIVHYDGELNIDKQRQDLELIASGDWDFIAVHPSAVNAYVEPIRQLVARGIPVIDMDTRLSDDLDGLGITTFLEPDNVWMGEQVTNAIISAVGSFAFEIIHTQGQLTHTGAQGRAKGFEKAISRYPGITVVDETPGNWDIDKVSMLWDELLMQYPNLKAGFLHNDDMALAALRSVEKSNRKGQIVLGGVDGMQEACDAVRRGDLIATIINPTGRIHGGAVWIGYFLSKNGDNGDIPRFIRMDGGLVNSENAAGYIWLGNHLII